MCVAYCSERFLCIYFSLRPRCFCAEHSLSFEDYCSRAETAQQAGLVWARPRAGPASPSRASGRGAWSARRAHHDPHFRERSRDSRAACLPSAQTETRAAHAHARLRLTAPGGAPRARPTRRVSLSRCRSRARAESVSSYQKSKLRLREPFLLRHQLHAHTRKRLNLEYRHEACPGGRRRPGRVQ